MEVTFTFHFRGSFRWRSLILSEEPLLAEGGCPNPRAADSHDLESGSANIRSSEGQHALVANVHSVASRQQCETCQFGEMKHNSIKELLKVYTFQNIQREKPSFHKVFCILKVCDFK